MSATPLVMRSLLSAALATTGIVLALQASLIQAQPKSCHPDGKPTESEVVFNSSGGTYGENVIKAFFTAFEKECGIKVTQVTDARTYAQMKQYVQSGKLVLDTVLDVNDVQETYKFGLYLRPDLGE